MPEPSPRVCPLCAVLGDLAAIAQHELREGRWDDVEEALAQIQAYVENAMREGDSDPRAAAVLDAEEEDDNGSRATTAI